MPGGYWIGSRLLRVRNQGKVGGYGYKDKANAIHKQVWDAGVPCLPGDCLCNQINNHPDYTTRDLWHVHLLAKDKRSKDPAAALRFYTENACDGDPANKAMATMVLSNDRILSVIEYAGFMGMDPRAVCALMTMPEMQHGHVINEG